jgi:hypothetical protein
MTIELCNELEKQHANIRFQELAKAVGGVATVERAQAPMM